LADQAGDALAAAFVSQAAFLHQAVRVAVDLCDVMTRKPELMADAGDPAFVESFKDTLFDRLEGHDDPVALHLGRGRRHLVRRAWT
jgi:hypothetical protein